MMYTMCKTLIQKGQTQGLQEKLDTFFLMNRLTEAEYKELTGMLNGGGNE